MTGTEISSVWHSFEVAFMTEMFFLFLKAISLVRWQPALNQCWQQPTSGRGFLNIAHRHIPKLVGLAFHNCHPEYHTH